MSFPKEIKRKVGEKGKENKKGRAFLYQRRLYEGAGNNKNLEKNY